MDKLKLIQDYPARIQRNSRGQWILGDSPSQCFYDAELTIIERAQITNHNEKYPLQTYHSLNG